MIKLHPSEIHFSQNFLPRDGKGTSSNGSQLRSLPKLQVFKKSGCFFALDNNALLLYRDMEADGECEQVDVEVIPDKIIPKAIMATTTCCTNIPTTNRHRFGENGKGALYSSDTDECCSECEDSEGDCYETVDDLKCFVCNKTFRSVQELISHQINKKHFGCYACGNIYPSSKQLKQHKHAMRHFSDEESDND